MVRPHDDPCRSGDSRDPAAANDVVRWGEVPILPHDAAFGAIRQTHAGDPPELRESWRFIALMRVANFAGPRRHLGRPRADRLIIDIADRIHEAADGLALMITGRSMIELSFTGSGIADLAARIDSICRLFAQPLDLDGEAHLVDVHVGAAGAPITMVEDVRLA